MNEENIIIPIDVDGVGISPKGLHLTLPKLVELHSKIIEFELNESIKTGDEENGQKNDWR